MYTIIGFIILGLIYIVIQGLILFGETIEADEDPLQKVLVYGSLIFNVFMGIFLFILGMILNDVKILIGLLLILVAAVILESAVKGSGSIYRLLHFKKKKKKK